MWCRARPVALLMLLMSAVGCRSTGTPSEAKLEEDSPQAAAAEQLVPELDAIVES
ncbi:MAG: hypothetical protein GY722_17090, partial [bacterium]|nr:hypothetical protein [bacterium]